MLIGQRPLVDRRHVRAPAPALPDERLRRARAEDRAPVRRAANAEGLGAEVGWIEAQPLRELARIARYSSMYSR